MARPIAHDGKDKYCGGCKQTKPLSAFSCRTDRAGGYQSRCKACRKRWHDERRANLAREYLRKLDGRS